MAAALAALNLPLSISHQILPEFREYERASTVLVNAYLQPVMQSYFERLRERLSLENPTLSQKAHEAGPSTLPRQASESLRISPGGSDAARTAQDGAPARIFVMQSSGGITALATAAEQPVRTVLSGPAGGIVGAAAVAQSQRI